MCFMNVAVIGWGQFGQAIGSLLEHNNVTFETAGADRPLSQPADLVFLMVPTQSIRAALRANKKFITPDTVIVNGAKGIEEKTHYLPHQIVQSSNQFKHYYSLIGPSFAAGIINQDPTLVSLGYDAGQHAENVKALLETPYFRVQDAKGYKLLELSSALKNVYAIVCGYADGLGFGMNTKAKLIALAFAEIMKLAEAMDMLDCDVTEPGVVGDLVLTCSSSESRNFKFGRLLSRKNQATALKKSRSTVEGFYTSHSMQALVRKYGVDLPVAVLAHKLISHDKDGQRYFHQFVETL